MKYGEEFYTDQSGFNYYRYRLCKSVVKCSYRSSPIPGTGNKWGRRYSVLRRMRTTSERRWSLAYPEYIRAARNKSNLPSHYDDFARGDLGCRSWKKCKKKKQWM